MADGGDIFTSTDGGVTWTDQTTAGSQEWGNCDVARHHVLCRRTRLAAVATGGDIWTATLDFTPTVISSVAASPSINGATITWTTDLDADSDVEYGTTTSYGSDTGLNSTLTTTHSEDITGLTCDTSYHYEVLSRTPSGVLSTSTDQPSPPRPVRCHLDQRHHGHQRKRAAVVLHHLLRRRYQVGRITRLW